MGFYVVSARSRASAILYPGQQLIIECNYADWGPLKVIFQTRYLDGGYDAPVPTDLWADIRGNAPDLASAVHAFVNTAAEIANIVVLGVNATLGKLELELALDASPGLNEHEFLQSFMPDLPLISVPGRSIDAEAIAALVAKVNGHPERRRVMRAIAQYTEALRSWVVGNEIPCLAHLYMGVV